MGNKLYKCRICGALFDTFEECEFHIEHYDALHEHELEKNGLWNLIEEVEPQDLSYKYYPNYPGYKYPYKDEYPIQITNNIFTNQEKTKFYDTVSKKVYNADELIRFLKEKGRLEELKEFLKWKIKTGYERIAKITGVVMREEDLEKMSEKELLSRMLYEYFTHKDKRERLGLYVLESLRKTKDFLSGKSEICPFCNLSVSNTFLTKKFEANRIMRDLNLDKTELYQKFLKSKGKIKLQDVLKKLGYKGKYEGEPIFLSLGTLIHLALDHKERFQRLLNEGKLRIDKRAVNNYFKFRRWEKKRSNKALMKLGNSEIEEKLSPSERLLKKWLENRD